MQAPHVARPDSDASDGSPQGAAFAGGDGQPASSGTAVVSSQGDPTRQAFEVWLAKGTPGRTIEDLWYAFLTGHMLAEVTAARGYTHALAILQGEKPPGSTPLTAGEQAAVEAGGW